MCKDKSKTQGENENKMATILKLNEPNKNILASPTIDISFSDMVMDKVKRKCVYAEYDSKYKSTVEEDEIFNKMTAHMKRRDR